MTFRLSCLAITGIFLLLVIYYSYLAGHVYFLAIFLAGLVLGYIIGSESEGEDQLF